MGASYCAVDGPNHIASRSFDVPEELLEANRV